MSRRAAAQPSWSTSGSCKRRSGHTSSSSSTNGRVSTMGFDNSPNANATTTMR